MGTKAYDHYRQLVKNRRYAEAVNFAEQQFLEGNRPNPFWLTRQSAALRRLDKFDRALAVSRQGLALNPSDVYCILEVGEALCGLKRYEDALPYYLEISKDKKLSGPSSRGTLRCLAGLKRWDDILAHLAAWNMPPKLDLPWRAQALEGLNRLEDAVEVWKRWLKVQPDNPRGLWALTNIEIHRDGLETVLKKYGKLAKIPSRPVIYKEIYASLCRRAGKTDQAVRQYEALARGASGTKAHKKQAFALAKSGRESEAIPMMEELLKRHPSDVFLNSGYIGACGRISKLDQALLFYEDLIQACPDEGKIYGRIKEIKKKLAAKP